MQRTVPVEAEDMAHCVSQATRSIVITINNFAGEGLGPLTCAHLRLTDVTAADANQHKSMGWFRFSSTPGAHKDRPSVVMAKLYKVSLTASSLSMPFTLSHLVRRTRLSMQI